MYDSHRGRKSHTGEKASITTGNKKAVGTHEIKMHIEVFDDGGKSSICRIEG